MKEVEDKGKKLNEFIHDLMAHYPSHIIKVVLGNHPECGFCAKMEEWGIVAQDEGKMVKGLHRTAKSFGEEVYVLVPKSWLGKKVRVSLIE